MSAIAAFAASDAWVVDDFFGCCSLGRGFFASSALNPGGGNEAPPPADVEVSVAYPRRGSSSARAWSWGGRSRAFLRRNAA